MTYKKIIMKLACLSNKRRNKLSPKTPINNEIVNNLINQCTMGLPDKETYTIMYCGMKR